MEDNNGRMSAAERLAADKAAAAAWAEANRALLTNELPNIETAGDALDLLAPDEAAERDALSKQERAGDQLWRS